MVLTILTEFVEKVNLEKNQTIKQIQNFPACKELTDETGTIMANSEDSDEMPHNAAFHLGLHCLLD